MAGSRRGKSRTLRNLCLPGAGLLACALSLSPAAQGQETETTGWKLGGDLYYGVSNLPGAHRYRDGFWIGAGRTFPSNISANYTNGRGLNGKVAVSLGEIYNGGVAGFDQPVEAYVSQGRGTNTFTAGKFYVPFELQEWEYETEWGLQAAHEGKAGTAVLAVTDNRVTDAGNVYGRFSRQLAPGVTGGLSLAAGRGFNFDSRHDKGAALDLTAERGHWKWDSVISMARRDGSEDQFLFAYGRITYTQPRWSSYVARHTWNDRSGDISAGHYSTLGGSYLLTEHLALEGALSRSGNTTIRWLQGHYTLN